MRRSRLCRAGDVLVVYRLDRLGRNLAHLIDTVESLRQRDIGFVSTCESIDTTTPAGRLFLHLLGALAQFERELLVERTVAGISAAKARGTHCGRRRTLTWEQLDAARHMLSEGKTQRQIARLFKISDRTLSRRLREAA
jgi:DNA invertase Pin-like site-specific DNA recombinase